MVHPVGSMLRAKCGQRHVLAWFGQENKKLNSRRLAICRVVVSLRTFGKSMC